MTLEAHAYRSGAASVAAGLASVTNFCNKLLSLVSVEDEGVEPAALDLDMLEPADDSGAARDAADPESEDAVLANEGNHKCGTR